MMQHKFDDISRYVSLQGMLKAERVAAEAARVASERESASSAVARASLDSGWMIVHVDSGSEESVKSAMLEAGIEACVPMRKGPKRKRCRKWMPVPVIPVLSCFVFAYCKPTASAHRGIRSFKGVRGVLMRGLEIELMSDEKMIDFKQKAADGHFDWERLARTFTVGDSVTTDSGPFAGVTLRVEAFAGMGSGDAVVTATVFGKPISFNVAIASLEKV